MSRARNVITSHARCITAHAAMRGEIMLIYSVCILGGEGRGKEVTCNKIHLISLSRMRNQTIPYICTRDRETFSWKTRFLLIAASFLFNANLKRVSHNSDCDRRMKKYVENCIIISKNSRRVARKKRNYQFDTHKFSFVLGKRVTITDCYICSKPILFSYAMFLSILHINLHTRMLHEIQF